MKGKLSLLVTVVMSAVLTSCTVSKRVSFLAIPGETETAPPVDVQTCLQKYGNYAGVFLDYTESIEHSGEKGDNGFSGWTFYWISTRKYVVIDPDYRSLTTVTLPDRPGRMYLRTIDPDGTIRAWGREDLIEQKDSEGNKVYKFAIPDIKRGTVVEEGYEFGGRVGGVPPPLSHDIPLQFRLPCEHLKVSYAYPDWWQVNVKRLSGNRFVPYQKIADPDNHKITMVYEAHDIPALRDEPYAPYFMEVANYFQFMITHFEMRGIKYDPVNDWDGWADAYHKHFLKKARASYPVVDSIAKSATAGLTAPGDMLAAILDWVRANVKRGSNSRDGNAAKVVESGSGFAIDECELTRAMVTAAGMKADVVLLHSASDGYFDAAYYDWDQFGQPAVRVAFDNATYLLFPYWEKAPYNFTPENYLGQPALIVTGTQIGSIVTIPEAAPSESLVDEKYDITIGENGACTVNETKTLGGWYGYWTRQALADMNADQKRDYLKEWITFHTAEVDLKDFTVTDEDDYHKPLVIKLKYDVPNLVTVTPEEILVQTAELLTPKSYQEKEVDTTDRQNPVSIDYDEHYRKVITLHYPANWKLAADIPEITKQNDLGQATRTREITPGQIEITQDVRLKHGRAPKESIAELAALIGKHSVLDLANVIFSVQPGS